MEKGKVGIIDYGAGNLRSVYNMLKYLNIDSVISSNSKELERCDKLILPGVGKFDWAIKELHRKGLFQAIRDQSFLNKPILGICLGAQLLLEGSEEGCKQGLGIIPGTSKKFPVSPNIRVPHMGWNTIDEYKSRFDLFEENGERRFYFAHSYYMDVDEAFSLAKTNYGKVFSSAIYKESVIGVQFHPEKSLYHGMNLFQKFSENV